MEVLTTDNNVQIHVSVVPIEATRGLLFECIQSRVPRANELIYSNFSREETNKLLARFLWCKNGLGSVEVSRKLD